MQQFPLPPSIGSVEVYPWDVWLPLIHDLPYRPRPVFQSYAAFTTKLSEMNARHLISAKPETLLFQVKTIDGRLPTVDDAQKRVVGTDKIVDRAALKRHIHSAAREPWPVGDDRELAIPGYNELSVRGAKARLDDLNAEQLRRIREYELYTRQRKTLIHEIDRRLKTSD